MSTPLLILPIGISGSGKSTWSLSMAEKGYKIVSTDGLRKEITGTVRFNAERNHEIREEAGKRIARFLTEGHKVILDATNINTSQRRWIISTAQQFFPGIEIRYKIFVSDVDTSEQRVQKDLADNIDRSPVTREVMEAQMVDFLDTLEKIKEEGLEPFDDSL